MTGPEDTPRQIHQGESIRISELVDERGRVQNRDFIRCTIQGPALLMLDGGTVHSNKIDGFPDECLYYVEEGRERYPGAIIVSRCGFDSCIFANVGFTGLPDNLEAFKGGAEPL